MADHNSKHGASANGGKPHYDDINTPVIVLVGVLSTIVTIATIALVQGLCYQWEKWELNSERKQVVNYPATVEVTKQKAELDGSDKTISIDDAMKQVVAEFGGNSSQSDH